MQIFRMLMLINTMLEDTSKPEEVTVTGGLSENPETSAENLQVTQDDSKNPTSQEKMISCSFSDNPEHDGRQGKNEGVQTDEKEPKNIKKTDNKFVDDNLNVAEEKIDELQISNPNIEDSFEEFLSKPGSSDNVVLDSKKDSQPSLESEKTESSENEQPSAPNSKEDVIKVKISSFKNCKERPDRKNLAFTPEMIKKLEKIAKIQSQANYASKMFVRENVAPLTKTRPSTYNK